MSRARIEWKLELEKLREWGQAKQALSPNGIMLSDGSKLRREDSGLEHSFIVVSGKILAMAGEGIYLGRGAEGKVKIAEDEFGGIYALKIMSSNDPTISTEGWIATDLSKAIGETIRASKSITPTGTRMPAASTKHYIAYRYFGIPVLDYLTNHNLSKDQLYDLSIKITFAMHELHSGEKSKSTIGYVHTDPHFKNITISESGEIEFIDFGCTNPIDDKGHVFFTMRSNKEVWKTREYDVSELMGYLAPSDESISYGSLPIIHKSMMIENKNLYDLFMSEKKPSSAIELCKKLTLIRSQLDDSTLYNQNLSNTD
jgi:serine/threonine protein kinase